MFTTVLAAVGETPIIVFQPDWRLILTFLVGTLLPLLVATVTTKVTSSRTRGILLAVLSLVTSIVSGILDALVAGKPYDLGANLILFGGVFAWAVVSYFGIWRATGPNDSPSISEKLTVGGLRRDRRAR